MRMALTGANGFIGGYVLEALLKAGHDVVCLCRSDASLQSITQDCEKRLIEFTPESCIEATKGCAAIIHLAGRRSVRSENGDHLSAYLATGAGMLDALCDAAVAHAMQHFVQASSIAVYGKGDERPYREDAACNPVNNYGFSKLVAEHQARWRTERTINSSGEGKDGSFTATHLRIAACYGAGEKESPALMAMAAQARNGEPISVTNGGLHAIDQIYVEDVAAAFVASLQDSNPGGAFNIGAGQAFRVLDIAKTANTVYGSLHAVQMEPAQPGTGLQSQPYMAIDLARKMLGWSPAFSLQEGMAAMAKLQK